ncbi:hypothetical protein C1T28_08250 [Bacillus subtilis]|nr:hypothetical protein C1T25_09820 [Bacillus cereus]POO74927.1 hypothetical protein C1T28_08250 [Bacillus subtilis]
MFKKRDKVINVIYDIKTLEGSCYIEVLPDRYNDKCWNASSIFFTEDNFGYIVPVFEKCYKKFDYFGVNEIDTDTWKIILKELESLKRNLTNDPKPESLKGILGFPFCYSEKEFMENYNINVKQLCLMITEFQLWIEEKSVSAKFISILGM